MRDGGGDRTRDRKESGELWKDWVGPYAIADIYLVLIYQKTFERVQSSSPFQEENELSKETRIVW